jgi:hypothetical protein
MISGRRTAGVPSWMVGVAVLFVWAAVGLAACGGSSPYRAECEKKVAGYTGLTTESIERAAAIKGCEEGLHLAKGQSPATSTSAPPATSSGASNAATTSTPGTMQSLTEVGTVTHSGSTTAFSEQYSLGKLGYGPAAAPPANVLEACGEPTSSAYAPGQLTLHYTKGTVPLETTIATDVAVSSILDPSLVTGSSPMILEGTSNNWTCAGQTVSLSLQPNESKTLNFWLVLPGVQTNEHPTLSQEQLNGITMQASVNTGETTATESFSGPQAADCEGTHHLLPFAHLPFTTSEGHENTQHTVTCNPTAGVPSPSSAPTGDPKGTLTSWPAACNVLTPARAQRLVAGVTASTGNSYRSEAAGKVRTCEYETPRGHTLVNIGLTQLTPARQVTAEEEKEVGAPTHNAIVRKVAGLGDAAWCRTGYGTYADASGYNTGITWLRGETIAEVWVHFSKNAVPCAEVTRISNEINREMRS